jgi:iron complex outermembrane receptor protein
MGNQLSWESSVLLAQLSADAIENIEVITVPTARYDAQGKGGIINVVTKRTEWKGFRSLEMHWQEGHPGAI